MPKKILIFSLGYYPMPVGGAEVAIKEITDRISPEEYEFHMVCNQYNSELPKEEIIGNIHVYRIGLTTKNPDIAALRRLPLHLNKLFYQWNSFWFAKKLHKQEQFDGIWSIMAHSTGVPAGKFKKTFPDTKYLLTLQEGDPPAQIGKQMRLFGKAFTDTFVIADAIHAISTFLGNWAKKRKFSGEPIIIPNAVTVAKFTKTYSEEELQVMREKIGKKPGNVFLVTTSRLVHKNAVDDVIRSMAQLPKHVHFLVCGTGPDEKMLKSLAKELHVESRVHFHGHVEHAVMPKYLKACDIFIRPSRSEGMGNSFVEAMAAGLPVIATQEGGIADFLFDEKRNPEKETTGWAVDANSPEQIVTSVNDIMYNSDKIATVTAHAKQMVLEKYDWDIIATDMETKVFNPLFY